MESIEGYLSSIVGLECWLVIAGTGSGSVLELGFGAREPRRKILRNPTLLEEEREFEPEHSLLIACAWRLSQADTTICGWRDDNNENGRMRNGLRVLRGQSVSSITRTSELNDMRIEFSNGAMIDIFCDQTNPDESDNDYILFTGKHVITVAGRMISLEHR